MYACMYLTFFLCFLWETMTMILVITGDITPQQSSRFMRFAILWFKLSLAMSARTKMTLFQFALSIVKTLLDAEKPLTLWLLLYYAVCDCLQYRQLVRGFPVLSRSTLANSSRNEKSSWYQMNRCINYMRSTLGAEEMSPKTLCFRLPILLQGM